MLSRDRMIDVVGWLLVAALSTAWCLTAGPELGATFDEPDHIREGLRSWRSGSNKQLMTWGAMPLPIDVQTLPLYVIERWRGQPYEEIIDLKVMMPIARMATLPFWWLLLLYVMRWGRWLGGPWAGRVALALVGSDPNFLGHACLATTDFALTSLVLIATYHFAVNRSSPWLRRVFIPGVLYGLALSAKASALPYVPLLYLLFGSYDLAKQGALSGLWSGRLRERFRAGQVATSRLRWDLVQIVPIGIVVVFAYCGSDWAPEPTFVAWAEKLPEGSNRDAMVSVSRHLTIFPNAGEGLIQQIKHNMRGHHGSVVLGKWYPKAVWFYFPVALALKLPDATLILLLAVLLIRPRGLLSPTGCAVTLLLLFSLSTRVQIGVRLIFPLIAFLMVTLGVAVTDPTASPWKRIVLRTLGGLTILANLVTSLSIWPDGIRYINTLGGGTEKGYTALADSNYDWGQGIPELTKWYHQAGEPPLAVWYYGSSGNAELLQSPFLPILIHMAPQPTVEELRRQVGKRYLAVGITLLTDCPIRTPELLATIDWLNQRQPIARTRTFLIYDLGPGP